MNLSITPNLTTPNCKANDVKQQQQHFGAFFVPYNADLIKSQGKEARLSVNKILDVLAEFKAKHNFTNTENDIDTFIYRKSNYSEDTLLSFEYPIDSTAVRKYKFKIPDNMPRQQIIEGLKDMESKIITDREILKANVDAHMFYIHHEDL